MAVKQFMMDGVEPISPNKTVLDAALSMKKLNLGTLPVIDETSKIIGILTDRDIVVRVIAENLPMTTQIKDVMTKPVHVIKESSEIGVAISKMAEKKVRRLPVIDENEKISGIISIGDLMLHQLTDARAGFALKEISEITSDPNNDLEVDDFPL